MRVPKHAVRACSRRTLLAGAASALIVGPGRVRAQPSAKILRVGYVGLQGPDAPTYRAFLSRMEELGYHAGGNFTFDNVQATSLDDYPVRYAELVSRKPDILLTAGSEVALRAAEGVAGVLPIILLAIDFDPLAKGYVPSLARPGGNVTGIFVPQLDLARKRVELTRELLPQARQLGVFWDRASREQAEAAAEAARAVGLAPRLIEVTGEPPDYAAAFGAMADAGGEPVVIGASAVFIRDRVEIQAAAREHSRPMIAPFRENVVAGAVMSYGVDVVDLFHDIADVVDRVAKGAKPAELPIEPPTRYHLALNLKSAAALGLSMPQAVLARADEVIE
ncbi:MAG TPA: ABC transporter substrate-binding protein [Stellaceae bacterium]|nr:ABC transporter substrate-binding protein [Stellaceae bacterium]